MNATYTNDFIELFNRGTTTIDFSVTPYSAQFLSTAGSTWARTDLTAGILLPGHYFLTRGGSLGVGFPGAVGMKIAHPDRAVVGFAGDGGSMYTYQALWTAVRHGVAASFVVCNNHRYQLLNLNIDQYWRERGIERHPYPHSFDLSHPEIDFVGLARALGADAMRVDKPDQVPEAVERILSAQRPFLVDLLTDDLIRP